MRSVGDCHVLIIQDCGGRHVRKLASRANTHTETWVVSELQRRRDIDWDRLATGAVQFLVCSRRLRVPCAVSETSWRSCWLSYANSPRSSSTLALELARALTSVPARLLCRIPSSITATINVPSNRRETCLRAGGPPLEKKAGVRDYMSIRHGTRDSRTIETIEVHLLRTCRRSK
ncbi:uncharacterized protein LOC143187110 [Calliopsis andreniformis]|uniref:uncharacterized protein LOC143187110 n=1 Tax=Calliopsis andreniformis TaxID=337506 RepID=UPI003FCD86FB